MLVLPSKIVPPPGTANLIGNNLDVFRRQSVALQSRFDVTLCLTLQDVLTDHLCILSRFSCLFHECPVSCPLLLVSVCYTASDMGHLAIESTLRNKNNYTEFNNNNNYYY